ncbi:MAG TPA: dienelactone hydrolase family protein [Isosphaeraceae bacterium]|jgi:carboxymethylenebutenolidase
MKPVMMMVLGAALLAAVPASAQDGAKARLERSPRHQEWVKVTHGDRAVQSFIVYPEVKDKATAVVVIHEIFGLSDWVRGVADQLAEAGYIAIAPDLLSGMAPEGGGTEAFSGRDSITRAVSALPADQVTADVDAAIAYVRKVPACNGKVAVAGFCWGGGQAFRLATVNPDLAAAFVFYGPGPNQEADIARIRCPVYGFYGGNDARIGATIPTTSTLMKAAGKTYEPVTYEGAGHGFLRSGEEPGAKEADKKARDEAWERWKGLLKSI